MTLAGTLLLITVLSFRLRAILWTVLLLNGHLVFLEALKCWLASKFIEVCRRAC